MSVNLHVPFPARAEREKLGDGGNQYVSKRKVMKLKIADE